MILIRPYLQCTYLLFNLWQPFRHVTGLPALSLQPHLQPPTYDWQTGLELLSTLMGQLAMYAPGECSLKMTPQGSMWNIHVRSSNSKFFYKPWGTGLYSFLRGIFKDLVSTLFNIVSSAANPPPPDSTVSEKAGIKLRTVVTSALAVRPSNLLARSHPQTQLDLILDYVRSYPNQNLSKVKVAYLLPP